MSAHHGPPCGHTVLGTCPGCGGHPLQYTLTNAPCTYAPVTVTAEALAEAQRQIGALARIRQRNDEMLAWLMKPMVFAMPKVDTYGWARFLYCMGIGPTIKGTFYIPPDPPPVDPLDVKHDGLTLRYLLSCDRLNRQENETSTFTPAQRAAVSAHWSAQLRAKVAAGAAADKARATSVVVDLEDW